MKHDILSRFIELGEAGDDGSGGGGFGDDKSLRDVVLNFVIAGRDTTATTLSWFTHMAMSHPDVAEKLRRELCAFEAERAREEGVMLVPCGGADAAADDKAFAARVAQFAGLLTYDSLGKLVYLHACVTETLRLYPAVPQVSTYARPPIRTPVRCNADVAAGGHRTPAGRPHRHSTE
jgi:cytochrome P450